MDAIREQEELRREIAEQAKLVNDLQHRAEQAARSKAARERAHKSEVFEVSAHACMQACMQACVADTRRRG